MKAIFALSLALTLLFSSEAYAKKRGQSLVDSLQNELRAPLPDTTKLAIMYQISFECSFFDPNQGLLVSNQIKNLAEKVKSKIWVAKSVF